MNTDKRDKALAKVIEQGQSWINYGKKLDKKSKERRMSLQKFESAYVKWVSETEKLLSHLDDKTALAYAEIYFRRFTLATFLSLYANGKQERAITKAMTEFVKQRRVREAKIDYNKSVEESSKEEPKAGSKKNKATV